MAEDVLQDALFIICRRMTAVREPQWFRAWCYRIATREAVRGARSERFWATAEGEEAIAVLAADPADEADAFDSADELLERLETLPPAASLVLRMRYSEGMTYREIAEALEIPLGTVKSRAAYGVALLKRLRQP